MLKDLQEILHTINPSLKELRRFGVALGFFLALFAYLFGFVALYYAAATSLAVAAVFPAFFRPVHLFLMAITFPIGWILSRVFLILFFFTVITPMAAIRRLLRYDHLKLRFDEKQATTYWEDFEQNTEHDTMGL